MPFFDETSPVGPGAGSVRRPPPGRTRPTSGGGSGRSGSAGGAGARRAASAGRARTTAARNPSGRPVAGSAAGRAGSGGSGRPPGNGGGGGGGGGRPPGGRPPGGNGRGGNRKPARSKKQRRRRRLRIALAAILGLFVLLGVFVGVVYASTTVPDPSAIASKQTTVLYYSDGKTQLARLGSENRTNVPLSQVSEAARDAVLSAENRSFYSDPGISFSGIVRATWNDLTGGNTQGGSTITQQYVKNAILENSSQTFSRKFKELFLAVKLDNSYSKDDILKNYLNTIYFGRGAYGIEAAANTYFGVHAAQLTAQQGAVLAVLIRSPSYYDPASHPAEAKARWNDVLDGMVKQGWLSQSARQASQYPPVRPKTASGLGIPSGPQGLVVQKAIDELRGEGYSDQQIRAGGLRITTTVSKSAEDAAIAAVNDVMQGEPTQGPDGLRESLVAIDPRTGAVVAYYGGPNGTGHDYASDSYRPPGSSMKPYTLATGLEQGIGVMAIRNGTSPQTFDDRPFPVHNAGSEACSACTLKTAITESLNTVFYGEAYDVGPEKVRQVALKAMDMPDVWPSGPFKGQKTLAQNGKTGGAIGIGQYELRTIDQAHGFATFAAGGIERDPYFVKKVTDNEGRVLVTKNGSPGQQVMPADVAHDVTYALEDVAAWSHDALAGGRPSAAKTGTQNLADSTVENSDSWMVGYTPSISTAVWMGTDQVGAIRNAAGRPIYGAGLPGKIWKEFMDSVLQGTPFEQLPSSPIIQGDTGHPSHPTVAPPSPKPTPTPTATATPTRKHHTPPADTSSSPATDTATETPTPTTSSSPPSKSPPPKSTTSNAPGSLLPTGRAGGSG